MKKLIAIYACVFLVTAIAHAQIQAAAPSSPVSVSDVPSALAALVHFLFPSITPTQAVTAVFLASRILRKALPDRLQATPFGVFLAHTALEVNPSQEKLQAAIPAQPAK